ncbi:hypothetical protein BC938DRAFT_481711 [Jimgerdemannia flammicorona]|uniref:Peptide hydrolase n=1 Tax=Jimgerdemannia flammicorona TaxID=994334 RepID=A0A433QFM6_9FUNG|nr:hypothetical protein BC938DRAFT_481711 [Jimgerdemannia flammicorona]
MSTSPTPEDGARVEDRTDEPTNNRRAGRTVLVRLSWPTKRDLLNFIGVYGGILLVHFIVYVIVYFRRNDLPAVLPTSTTNTTGGFSGDSAWAHLSDFTTTPHAYNSHQIGVVRNYLLSVLDLINTESLQLNRTTMEIFANDTTTFTTLDDTNTASLVESSNILVRVYGSGGSRDALLVSAHFDSVPTSNGTTDDGAGIVVMLELVRNLINFPVQHDVIFNFNNGEEIGLYGAIAFMNHPWAQDVKAFINIEGAGSGGRAMLFRASNYDLVSLYGGSSNRYPHLNVIGNDIFKLGLIASKTDFDIYAYRYGIPGLDIAFYEHRSFYHTIHDDLEHTSPKSIQHMGTVALATMRSIANSQYLSKAVVANQPSIYYDVLGHSTLVYTWKTYLGINIALILAVPLGFAAATWYLGRRTARNGYPISVWRTFLAPILRATGFLFLTVVGSILFCLLFGFFSTKANPMVEYGNAYTALICFSFASFSAIIGVQWGWAAFESRKQGEGSLAHNLQRERAAVYAMLVFWWVATVAATAAGAIGVGALYYVTWFAAFQIVGTLFMIVFEDGEGSIVQWEEGQKKPKGALNILSYFWVLRFMICTVFPIVLVADVAITMANALSMTLVDGTAPIFIVILFIVLGVTLTVPLLPFIHRSTNFGMPFVTFFLVFVGLFIAICILPAYNARDAPNKILYTQVVNLTDSTCVTRLRTARDLDAVLQQVPSAANRTCYSLEPASKYLQCEYPSSKPLWAQPSSSPPFNFTVTNSSFDATNQIKTVAATLENSNTLACFLDLSSSASLVTVAYIVGMDTTMLANVTVLTGRHRAYGELWNFSVSYKAASESVQIPAVATCTYDEWTDGQVPDLLTLKATMPDWSILGLRNGGMVSLNQDVML